MKRYLFFTAALLAVGTAHAQQDLNTAADAVRYSTDNLNGTARFRALSGAMGALGGDMSAITVNPAGSAIFVYNSGTASVTSYNRNNTSNYFGSQAESRDNSFDLNQLGAVFVFNNNNENAVMNKFSLAFNYENTNNFDDNIYAQGVNQNNSVANYFLRYANGIGNEGGITLGTLNTANYAGLSFIDQQAYLGYNAYVIDPVSDSQDNTAYIAADGINQSTGYYQENSMITTGYNGKIALNFGAQFVNRLYVGANLNIHFTDYLKTSRFYENVNNPVSGSLQSVNFTNERYTYGGGFSLDVGAIVKITEEFRAGVAYQSPTWYSLQDEIRQSIVSNCPECGGTSVTDSGLTFILDDYSIKTPSKWTGSLAYIFGKWGLISIDGSLKDYSNTEYRNSRYELLNTELSNNMTTAAEIRAGGELRIKNFSLRGGYRFEQSPYKNATTVGDLWGVSTGVGFTFGASRLDLAYNYFQREIDSPFLAAGVTSAGFNDGARVTANNNNITLSYTLDL